MTIQLNTDNNLSVHKAFGEKLSNLLAEELSRFSEYITRLELHLSDENSHKGGINDKRCVLEARIKGRQPIAVKDVANTYELAVNGAHNKLKASLDKVVGRMKIY